MVAMIASSKCVARRRLGITFLGCLTACGGARTAPITPTIVTIHWRIDRVTRTLNGADVDDGPLYVSLVLDRSTAAVRVGLGLGACSTASSFRNARVCGEPVDRLVTRLVCGEDPHVDRLICFDAIRTGARIEVTRREYDVPAVDGARPPATLVHQTKVDGVDVPTTATVEHAKTELRDIAE